MYDRNNLDAFIARHCDAIVAHDQSQGYEVRALLSLAIVIASGNGVDAAGMLMSAAVAAGHDVGVSLDEMRATLEDGFGLCVADEVRRVGS